MVCDREHHPHHTHSDSYSLWIDQLPVTKLKESPEFLGFLGRLLIQKSKEPKRDFFSITNVNIVAYHIAIRYTF